MMSRNIDREETRASADNFTQIISRPLDRYVTAVTLESPSLEYHFEIHQRHVGGFLMRKSLAYSNKEVRILAGAFFFCVASVSFFFSDDINPSVLSQGRRRAARRAAASSRKYSSF